MNQGSKANKHLKNGTGNRYERRKIKQALRREHGPVNRHSDKS